MAKTKIEIELNSTGIQEVLKSAEVTKELETYGEQIVGRCGDGYATETYVGKTRAAVKVKPDTPHAYYSNLKHNTILKAVGS